MYFIVYKTTNLINNKFYIGKHNQESNPYEFDGYYGSGTILMKAMKKYGEESFVRETLFIFENEEECLLKEKEEVEKVLGLKECYNMRSGGIGGFQHINNNPEERERVSNLSRDFMNGKHSDSNFVCYFNIPEVKERTIKRNKEDFKNKTGLWSQQSIENHKKAMSSESHRKLLSDTLKGETNGAYGSKVCINLETKEKRRFYKNEIIPDGWISSTIYEESKKEVFWYNDGTTNYLLKPEDTKIIELNLIKGRLPRKWKNRFDINDKL